MFCTNCGKELQDGWIMCPNCGTRLGEDDKEDDVSLDLSRNDAKTKSRDEIKAELISGAFSVENGVILFYGAGTISRDLVRILHPGEKVLNFCHAFRNSILGQFKSLRMFRDYMVCTNQRLIYIESGNRVFSLVPFFRKTISFPYNEIVNVVSDKRLGLFSGGIVIESVNKKNSFAVINRKSAEELRDFLNTMIKK